MDNEKTVVFQVSSKQRTLLNIGELWRFRELFYFFIWRDIKVKYKQTLLGFLWVVIQPIALMIIFSFINNNFNTYNGDLPYSVFVFSGIILWNVFSSGVSGAGNSMVTNAEMIKKIYFPRLIIPITSISVAMFDFFFGYIVFVGLALFNGISAIVLFKLTLVVPLALFIVFMFSAGIGSLIAALNVKYRDFRYIIPFFIQAFFFLSPVFFDFASVSEGFFKTILVYNPISVAITVTRDVLEQQSFNLNILFNGIFISGLMFVLGLTVFKRTEHYFADLI